MVKPTDNPSLKSHEETAETCRTNTINQFQTILAENKNTTEEISQFLIELKNTEVTDNESNESNQTQFSP